MRRRRYRAWDILNKKWFHIHRAEFAKSDFFKENRIGLHEIAMTFYETGEIVSVSDFNGNNFPINSVVLAESTGLKCMYNKDVYELDIVEVRKVFANKINNSEAPIIGLVVWNENLAAFRFKTSGFHTDDVGESNSRKCLPISDQALKVIGNIFEHPELLESGPNALGNGQL